ncbi:hypothetical protein NEOLEDRAFT_1130360 [Neolentinus lepideus HHB14362 ss-1]|uniref:C2H2-type domain-containing protein n=1 Tax=Neolentinus lepideus HHB14362 ss-1 TaxID=1314782 RepID=A0A165UAI4_9AGAM|nr:hypothetical protein NEOLEDRAFT_1130360 [Neolentinus lepideus HHB14362 ss-1]
MENIAPLLPFPPKNLGSPDDLLAVPAPSPSPFLSPSFLSTQLLFSHLRTRGQNSPSPIVETRLSTPESVENLVHGAGVASSKIGLVATCVDCLQDCKSGSCALELSAECTDQCVVVPCDDPSHELPAFDGTEPIFDRPCRNGSDCTMYEEFLQCCTDYRSYSNDQTNVSPSQGQQYTSTPFDLNQFLCDCEHGSALGQGADFFPHDANFHNSHAIANPAFFSLPSAGDHVHHGQARHHHHSAYNRNAIYGPHQQSPHSSSSSAFSSPGSPVPNLFAPGNIPPASRMHNPGASSPGAVTCMWGNCHAIFSSLQELVGHVNLFHLQPESTAQDLARRAGTPLSCHWGDCQVYPDPTSIPGPSSGNQVNVALNILANHLLQDHLGFTPPPPTSMPTPPKSGTPIPPEGHDCAGSTHFCKWQGCGRSFKDCDELTTHITGIHVGSGKSHYDCHWEGCNRHGENGFASKQKICRHLQSHTGHRPFQCDVCKQNFSEAATLQQHMRRHTQEKPYICDFPGCGKAFAITGALTIHKRTHNGEKPFKCPHCDKAFAESSNLSKHLRTHTGVRPYPCTEEGCNKCFARPDQLTRHMSVHRKKDAV